MTHPTDSRPVAGLADQPAPAPATKGRSPLLGVILLPLYFVVVFVFAYIGSSHNPVPTDMPLTLAGSSATTSQIATEINDRADGAFDITRTESTTAAITDVKERESAGAILIETTDADTVVTGVVASGGGRLAGTTVQEVAAQVAQELGATTAVKDVAPVGTSDSSGAGLFYLLVLCTMGAYLSVTAIFTAFPTSKRLTRALLAIVVSVLTPIIAFSALSFSFGGFGADFGQLAALLGTAMIYTLVVAWLSLTLNELLGRASVFFVVLFLLAGNLPSTGGSIPGSMLPPIWQWVHSLGFGSGAMSSFSSIIYFDGGGFGDPFYRLLLWLGGAALALLIVNILKSRPPRKSSTPKDHTEESLAIGTAPVDTPATDRVDRLATAVGATTGTPPARPRTTPITKNRNTDTTRTARP